MYSVYALVDPRDQTTRYIGMSKDPYRRHAMHLLYTGKNKTEKDVWIQELRQYTLAPTLSILETVDTQEEADGRETYWIQHYLSIGAQLTNMSKTGESEKRQPENKGEVNEMEDVIKNAGWTLIRRKRRGKGREYIYAAKRRGAEVIERYIAPASRIQDMTPEQILVKLQMAD